MDRQRRPGLAGRASRWWPPIWPSRSGPGCRPHLDHARRVADPFHVVRVGNRCVDQVRRRVQNETLGHRGRKARPALSDPQAAAHRQRTPRRTRQRSDAARAARRRPPRRAARRLAGQGIGPRRLPRRHPGRRRDAARQGHRRLRRRRGAPRSARSATTLASWRTEILAHHDTGASNGPTEGLNLCVKKVKRCGHGFRSFEHYRLRVLLHAGGITWPERPTPPRIRTRSPHSDA